MSGVLGALAAAALRGGALVAVAMLLSLAMRRSSAAARHAVVGLGILAHLLVPLVPSSAIHVRVPYPASDREVVEQTLSDASASARRLRPPGEGWEVAPAPGGAGSNPALADFAWILAFAWLGVTSLILGRYAFGMVRVVRLRASARPPQGELSGRAITAAAREAGLRRPPEVCFADVSMPVACGIVRPAVLLPEAAAGWSTSRLRIVLVHEMAHVRRRDVAAQGLAQVACALFWFDPLLWWARARLRADAESAADDAVLRAGTPADRYVLELVRLLRESAPAPLPAAAASIGRGLGARARRALDPHLQRDGVRRLPLTAGLLLTLAATFVLGAATPTATGPGVDRAVDGLASGCAWRPDGRHVNRWTVTAGRPIWQVSWEGGDCDVEMVAEPDAVMAGGILAPVVDGRVTVRLRRGADVDSAALVRDVRGGLEITASPGLARGVPLVAWLRAFADEIALHTAFEAPQRVDSLLHAGGVPAVPAFADATQGDHAAGVYLAELVANRRLTDAERVEVLRVATDHVSNDAVMTDLLVALAARRPIGERGPVRDAFDAAAATLRSRAAREAVRDIG